MLFIPRTTVGERAFLSSLVARSFCQIRSKPSRMSLTVQAVHNWVPWNTFLVLSAKEGCLQYFDPRVNLSSDSTEGTAVTPVLFCSAAVRWAACHPIALRSP